MENSLKDERDQRASLTVSWMIPRAQAELYVECTASILVRVSITLYAIRFTICSILLEDKNHLPHRSAQ